MLLLRRGASRLFLLGALVLSLLPVVSPPAPAGAYHAACQYGEVQYYHYPSYSGAGVDANTGTTGTNAVCFQAINMYDPVLGSYQVYGADVTATVSDPSWTQTGWTISSDNEAGGTATNGGQHVHLNRTGGEAQAGSQATVLWINGQTYYLPYVALPSVNCLGAGPFGTVGSSYYGITECVVVGGLGQRLTVTMSNGDGTVAGYLGTVPVGASWCGVRYGVSSSNAVTMSQCAQVQGYTETMAAAAGLSYAGVSGFVASQPVSAGCPISPTLTTSGSICGTPTPAPPPPPAVQESTDPDGSNSGCSIIVDTPHVSTGSGLTDVVAKTRVTCQRPVLEVKLTMLLFRCPNQPYGPESDWARQGCVQVGRAPGRAPDPSHGDSETTPIVGKRYTRQVAAPHVTGAYYIACTLWQVVQDTSAVWYGQSQSFSAPL